MRHRNHLRSAAASIAIALAFMLGQPAIADAKDAIVIDVVNEPSSLDPHVQWNPDSYYVYRNIFDNLLTRSDAGDIVPQIATEWTYLSDSEIEFTIRDDVAFHDGSKLTADDVAYSVKRITNPDFGSPQLGQFNQITDAVATAANKVKLTTKGPYPALLAQLVKLSIVPKAHVEKVGKDAFNLAPVGSGPYKFVNWQRGVGVTLARNDAYWGDKGAFTSAEFRAVPDAATRVANLIAGQSDLVVTLDPDLATQVEAAPDVSPKSVLTERVAYLRLNPAKPGLDDVRLRRAIAMSIDKELIVQGLLGGYDEPTDEMLTSAHVGWVDGIKGLGYDPEKAKALIAEVGEAAKRPMSFATAPVFDQRIVQALQQMLSDVGLNISLEMTDMSTYLANVRKEPADGPDMNFGRWSCACQDADGVLFPVLHSGSTWSSNRDADFDTPLEAARATLDESARETSYRKVHELVVERAPIVPLYRAAIIYGANDKLAWSPTSNESMFLNRMGWKE